MWITLHKSSNFDYQYEKIIVEQWTPWITNQKIILNKVWILSYIFLFHFLSATISMHSFFVTDHDRTALKSENHLFYFNLHVNLVIKKLFFNFFFHLLTTAWNLNSKNCNPLIFGKDRDWSKATLFHNWSMKESERKRETVKENSEKRNRELSRDF